MQQLILTLVLTLTASFAFAQAPFLVGGFNYTLPTVDAASNVDYQEEGKFGGLFGIRTDINTGSNLLANFGVQLNYKSIGYAGATLQILKIELPIYLGWKFSNFSVYSGPKIALTGDLSCSGCSNIADSDANEQFTLPFVVGGRMMFSEKFGGELYYGHALLPVARIDTPKDKFFDSSTGFNLIYML